MNSAAIEERFVLLETKLAYYDKTIADLNDVVVAQGREIEALRLAFEALQRQLGALELEEPAAEVPPHY